METFREERGGETSGTGIKSRLEKIEEELKYGQLKKETEEVQKEWKMPWKWKSAMNKSNGKSAEDKVLIFYLNIKGEMENPVLVPLYSGNIIIYKNKAYEFDPRAVWTVKNKRKIAKAVIIREIDRRPISNLDWDEIRERGDATDSDEILVKMVKKAVIEKTKKQISRGVIIFVIIAIVIGIVFFMFFK